jgi:hypothetical protein
MDHPDISKATRILDEAERKLLDLVVKSAEKGDYDGIALITSWAKTIRGLAGEHSVESAIQAHRPNTSQAGNLGTATETARTGRLKPNEYPVFYRERTSLVKIGWSKSQRSEYEHKVPESALDDLLDTLAKHGGSKGRFTIDAILPIRSSSDGNELPNYQLYLCVAWLRHLGLLMQHGRQGYSVKPGVDLMSRAKNEFRALSSREREPQPESSKSAKIGQ